MTIPDCWVCMDRGLVPYYARIEQAGDRMYEFIAACSCPNGQRYSRIPGIQTCRTSDEIRAKANYNQRYAVEMAAEEEMPMLQACGVKVDEIRKQIRNGKYTTYDPAAMRHHILAGTLEQIEKLRPMPPQGEQISLEGA